MTYEAPEAVCYQDQENQRVSAVTGGMLPTRDLRIPLSPKPMSPEMAGIQSIVKVVVDGPALPAAV